MKKYIVIIIIFVNSNLYAWDNNTNHKNFSELASRMSSLDNLLLNKDFTSNRETKSVMEWIQDGAFFEDAGSDLQAIFGTARFNNHFHNPLDYLTEAGLSDTKSGESALLWAQDGLKQINFVEGDWSWATVRDHWYKALTATDTTERDEFTVKAYRGLGHQMHLIQDMAQPDHTRKGEPLGVASVHLHILFWQFYDSCPYRVQVNVA